MMTPKKQEPELTEKQLEDMAESMKKYAGIDPVLFDPEVLLSKQRSTLLSQIRKHIEEHLSDNTYDFGEYYGVALDHVLDYLTQLEGEQ